MARNPAAGLRVKPVELLRSPGTTREYAGVFEPDALDITDDRIVGDLDVALVAESTIDGIVVRGTISADWTSVCRRCAIDVSGTATATVDELYQFDVTDDEAFVIDGNYIDLAPVIRQYALLELPRNVLCRDDCAGLCPKCGTDLNESTCDCDTEIRDPRWAALDDLDLE